MKEAFKKKYPTFFNIIKKVNNYFKIKWNYYCILHRFMKSPYSKSLRTKKKFIIFGTPTHGNLGDQAIVKAEEEFLKQHYPEYTIIEVPVYKTSLDVYFLRNIFRKGDLIFLHGGGNIGDLYLSNEIARRKVLQVMKGRPIIQFPQSYTFTSSKAARQERKMSQKIYSSSKNNFTLIARETKSLDLFRKYFPDNRILYTPDIVLILNERKKIERKGILLCLRSDSEKVISEENQSLMIDCLKEIYDEVNLTDTMVEFTVDKKTRDIELEKKWDEYRRSKVVITDRLHGMVFAILTGTPCIVFDNYNSKVKNTYYDWLSDYEKIKFVDVLNDFSVNRILEIINEIKDGLVPPFTMKDKYSPLLDEINKHLIN